MKTLELPETFSIINNSYHRDDESSRIHFGRIGVDGLRAGVCVYRRTADCVQQFSYNSLTTADKWAVKYCQSSSRKRNQYFTTKKAALSFALNL